MFAVRKLPARFAPVVLPLVLSILMTFVVSVISTLKSLGPTPAFLATWPGAWDTSRARSLGFPQDKDFETVIRDYVAETTAAS